MSLNPLRALRRLFEILYGLYALSVFLVLGLIAFLLVTLVPGLGTGVRRSIAHITARSFFFCAGIPVKLVEGQQLPAGACVVVANHASYLDGIVLKGALPAHFSFVIAKEFSRLPFVGLLLRRIGSEFVDRFNRHTGAMDARRLMKAADAGQALVLFPEGTFISQPGLGKFHTGAFVIAARSALPIVPIVIRGTRNLLPSGRFLPRPGSIEIQVLAPILAPANLDPSTIATMTRVQARSKILAALGEPDLAESDGSATPRVRKSGSA